MSNTLSASLALALAAPLAMPSMALAQTPAQTPAAELQTLRQEIQSMRQAYEDRLKQLEQRLMAAEKAAEKSAERPATTATSAPATIATPASQPAAANAFNPAMSLILSGGYTRTSQNPDNYRITGFQLPQGAEAGPGSRGLSLGETELGLSASIDPWLKGAAVVALGSDNTVSVEEAFIQTTGLGYGLTAKAGRFFSGIGYLNSQHAHARDFIDNPLAYQALLGTQYGDDGAQLRWLAPTDQYIELGAEVGRGRSYQGTDTSRNGAGMTALTLKTGGDLGLSHNWRAGVSMLNARATDQRLSGGPDGGITSAFNGRTRVWVLDGVWKWAPDGNATRTNFKLQGEYLRSTQTGQLNYDATPDGENLSGAYKAVQSGWYVQGLYQFMPRWRVGLRTERLNPGTPDFGPDSALLSASGYKPGKNALMLDYKPSEFSRVRLQLARDKSRQGAPDNQLWLQYQMSLGAHGAHQY